MHHRPQVDDDGPDDNPACGPPVTDGGWLDALALGPVIGAAAVDLTCRTLGTPAAAVAQWQGRAEGLVAAGLAVGDSAPAGTIRPAAAWRQRAEFNLTLRFGEGGPARVRNLLLDSWLRDPEPSLLEAVTAWASALDRLDVLGRVVVELYAVGGRASEYPSVVEAFARLPTELRHRSPRLSVAAAEAAMVLRGAEPSVQKLLWLTLRDAPSYYSRWRQLPELDDAVFSGTLWMVTQRLLPSQPPARSLEDAWQTQREVGDLIKQALDDGTPLALARVGEFHALSAYLAFCRGDLSQLAHHAEFASVFHGTFAADRFARSLRMAAASLLGEAANEPPEPAEQRPWPRLSPAADALAGAGDVFASLARALRALHALDRAGFDCALDGVTAADAYNAGCWALHAYIETVGGVVWGANCETLLTELDATIARFSVRSPEAREPLGRMLLTRARASLLMSLGAVPQARDGISSLPEAWQRAPAARSWLTTGDVGQALRVASAGLFDPETWLVDRVHLLVIQAAARFLDVGADADLRRSSAVRALRLCHETDIYLTLAVMPNRVRDALFDAYEEEAGRDDSLPPVRVFTDRLDHTRTASDGLGPIILTRREQVLLPL
ncbi:MAG: hypothetical protein AAGC63_08825, partial [Propionicimonas sp.]